jgi:hypothetical protein
MGFKITSVPSQVVVGNPFTSEWQTIPKSTETWGEVGNVLVLDRGEGGASFQIIAVREDATEIFHSKVNSWTKLRQAPPPGLQETTVLAIRDKLVNGTLCAGLLFCYGGDALVSFDVVAERWTEDRIPLPRHASSKCVQILECGGNLFAAVEDVARGTISLWGLGLGRREFFPLAEMPPQLSSALSTKKRGGRPSQLKAVGHKHRMYFWRNFSSHFVVFHFLPTDFQTFVDTSSFEP